MTEQEKREKVIKGLECCFNKPLTEPDCERCPYGPCVYIPLDSLHAEICGSYVYGLHADALALLKAQEPRVMTLEEVKNSSVEIWLETTDSFCGWGFSGEIDNSQEDTYGKTWRCWTFRPTDEQREAVKWDG